jgi:hypothetical protein
MRNFFSLLTLITLVSLKTLAQYHEIQHTTPGPQPIPGSGVNVTVTKDGNPGSGGTCCSGTLPYHIGAGGVPNGYKYAFSIPVNAIRLQVCNIGPGERIRIYINGSTNHYTLTSTGNLSPYCVSTSLADVSSGELTNTTSNEKYAQVDITDIPLINDIKVYHENGFLSGCYYKISFKVDTPVVFKQPFTDTMLCAGDSLNVDYVVNLPVFNSGNFFTVQLSDGTGSFSAPTNIGTINSTVSGTIKCKIPANKPSASNYKLRIVANSPSFAVTNSRPIRIDRFALPPSASGNDSLCVGYQLKLETKYYVPGMQTLWSGPDGWGDVVPNPIVNNLTTAKSGDYVLTASVGACKAIDTVKVQVYINPPIKDITNNGPLCEKDSMYITLTDTFGLPIRYEWSGPNGFKDTTHNPFKYGVTKADSGIYYLISRLGFCLAGDTTSVEVNTKPDNVTITSNSPVYPGNELKLNASTSTPGVTYVWYGPDSFFSTVHDPSILQTPLSANGTYSVTVSIGNCHTSATTVVVVQNPNGKNLNLYPNPTKGNISIRGIVDQDQDIPYIISDLGGTIIAEGNLKTAKKLLNATISLPAYLANGVYILKMKVDNEFSSHSIRLNK